MLSESERNEKFLTIVGEYNRKMNEIELYEMEENLLKITSHKSDHKDLLDLFRSLIIHQSSSSIFSVKSYFLLEISKKSLESPADPHSLFTVHSTFIKSKDVDKYLT
jgi:hypothetical protein